MRWGQLGKIPASGAGDRGFKSHPPHHVVGNELAQVGTSYCSAYLRLVRFDVRHCSGHIERIVAMMRESRMAVSESRIVTSLVRELMSKGQDRIV